jgi:hypothetical protein
MIIFFSIVEKPKRKKKLDLKDLFFSIKNKNTQIICIVIAFIVARRKSNFEE